MTFDIEFSPEQETQLRRQAEANGKDPATVVREVMEGYLAARIPQPPKHQTAEEWCAELRAWASSHKPVTHFVDDSREAIYDRDTE